MPECIEPFHLGRYFIAINFIKSECCSLNGLVSFIFFGSVVVNEKESTGFKLTIEKAKSCYRIKFQVECESNQEVNGNTSVRLINIPNPGSSGPRSRKTLPDIYVLHLDQLHILKKFQRKEYGTKLMALILTWAKHSFPEIKKCIVISPSSIGKPFYISLGAKQQISSSNVEFSY